MASDMRYLSKMRGRPSEIQSGSHSKCLTGRAFLLEIESRQVLKSVTEVVQNSGGIIMESFQDQDPNCVVSDHPQVPKLEKAKKDDPIFRNEKLLKTLPALVRQAIRRGVKIRTPQSFLNQLNQFVNRRDKPASATTSNSTIRGKPNLGRESSAKLEKATQKILPRTSRGSSDQSSTKGKEEKPFLRIDVPGRKPDIRNVSKELFGTLYCGSDSGFSIFKQADMTLTEKRRKEYDSFVKGKYEPTKKNFKLNEKDNYCQFCQKTINGERRMHERTDEHRNRARTQGLTPNLERIVLNARLRLQSQEKRMKRNQKVAREYFIMTEKSKRAGVEYEYGENELKANWQMLKTNTDDRKEEKISILSPRRRQKRIRQISSQGENDFL